MTLEKMDQTRSMPLHFAASSSRTSRIVFGFWLGFAEVSELPCLVSLGWSVFEQLATAQESAGPVATEHERGLAAQQLIGFARRSSQHDFETPEVAINAAAEARFTKNSGGVTSFFAAHRSFSASEWQQHWSQQKAAELQPQGQCSQGKRPSFSVIGPEIGPETGIPNMPSSNTDSTEMLTVC